MNTEQIRQELRVRIVDRLIIAVGVTQVLLLIFAGHSTMTALDWIIPILILAILSIFKIRDFKLRDLLYWEILLFLFIPLLIHIHFRYGGRTYAEGGIVLIAIAATVFIDSLTKRYAIWTLCLIAFTIFQVSRYAPSWKTVHNLGDAQGVIFIAFYSVSILIIVSSYLNAQNSIKSSLQSRKVVDENKANNKGSISSDTSDIFHRIGHDLRGPSQNIANMGRKISHLISSKDYDRLKALSDEFEASGSSMTYTVENVLNWANSKVIKKQGTALPIDINNAIQTILYKLKPLSQTKSLDFKIDVADGMQINSDPRLFEIILFNLIHNAAVYSSSKGTVSIQSNTEGEHGLIRLQNHGKPIGHVLLGLITNRDFVAIQKIKNDQETSYGLGLETCFNLATLIGMDIAISSTPDEGTMILLKMKSDA